MAGERRSEMDVVDDIVQAGIRVIQMQSGRKNGEPFALLLDDRATTLDWVVGLLEGLYERRGTFDHAIGALKKAAAIDRKRATEYRALHGSDN